MPSASDSRQPYKLSNLALVTLSLTLIAGTLSVTLINHLIEVMNARSGLFGYAANLFKHFRMIIVNPLGQVTAVVQNYIGT